MVLQSRNPEGYFLASHLPSILSIPNLALFCSKIPNPELQMRELPGPEKPIEDPLKSLMWNVREWKGANIAHF